MKQELPTIDQLKQTMMQESVTKLMASYKVPAWQLLQALKLHKEEMQSHQKTKSQLDSEREQHTKQIAQYEEKLSGHQDTLTKWQDAADHLLSIEHLKGDPGQSVEMQDVVDAVLPHLPRPEAIDQQGIVRQVLELIPEKTPEPVEDTLDREALFKEFVSRIQKERLIDVSHIKNAESFIFNGKKYKIEELMRGAGGTSGGSFAVQVPTGTVDGSNRTFVFTTAPSVIVLDNGNFMNKVSADGTVNWTGTTNVVLNQAPSFNIYGF